MDDHKDMADSFLQSEAMEEMRDYLARGRRFSEVSSDELPVRWVGAFKAWFAARDPAHQKEMDDFSAEMRLRDLPIPADQIVPEMAAMAEEIRQAAPNSLSDEGRQRISDYLSARRKLTN
ncbi:MAG: hypothetical protein QOI40_5005 [Alphaproteobacteria bacterium]|jgi:hypothetical protein|nr:hypothetical protein [Alphaproteobacteria bacterium]